jgi:DNA-binding transcriptional LysR family regulator
MNVELRHLRYFVAVAEEASFTSAARRVHVAQQVLSTQIRQLEDSIGVQLLERTSRGALLTAAGDAFLDAAAAGPREGRPGSAGRAADVPQPVVTVAPPRSGRCPDHLGARVGPDANT